MSPDNKVIVVMPAYNAAETLLDTYRSIPPDCVDKVILVDDGSIDETVRVAQELDLELIVHPHNAGYGANQKTCYMEALRQGAEIVIMLHPDGQYDPEIIPEMIAAIRDGRGDFVMGSRFLPPSSAREGGMPTYKYLANRFLTSAENLVMGTNLSECHTGYRAYSRSLLEAVPFLRNSNNFVFDTEMIFQAQYFGFHFAEVPVETKYFNEASSISFLASTQYGLSTLWVAARYLLHRSGLWKFDVFRDPRRDQHHT
jgi:glycosyltransferase involved in cell wall biosynthesis